MTLALVCSILFLYKIIRKFKTIFQCIEDMKLQDLKFRSNQLNYLIDIMTKDKLRPSNVAIL